MREKEKDEEVRRKGRDEGGKEGDRRRERETGVRGRKEGGLRGREKVLKIDTR